MELRVSKLEEGALLPSRAHEGDAGLDPLAQVIQALAVDG